MVEAGARRPGARRSSGTTTADARPSPWRTSSSRTGPSARSVMSAPSTFRTGPTSRVPLVWRFQKEGSGSGAHGDLNAHIIDMTRFVTGEEITEIVGAIAETFIKERKKMVGAAAGGIAAGVQAARRSATVDRRRHACSSWPASPAGAVASFEAARQATGNQNHNGLEINGDKGLDQFDFEDMN